MNVQNVASIDTICHSKLKCVFEVISGGVTAKLARTRGYRRVANVIELTFLPQKSILAAGNHGHICGFLTYP